MIRFAICDDDRAMTGRLESMVMELQPRYDQDFECEVFFSGEDFCAYLNDASKEAFDIVLMDIEMGQVTGVEAGKKLRESIANEFTVLLYVSAHSRYKNELVDLNVYRFIQKPIEKREFNLRLDRAINRILRQRQLPGMLFLTIKKNGRDEQIPMNSIVYLQSDARKIHLHTTDEIYTYYKKLTEEEKELDSNTFVRIHKSFLINFSHAKSISAKEVEMTDGAVLPIANLYREQVRLAYLQYRGSKE